MSRKASHRQVNVDRGVRPAIRCIYIVEIKRRREIGREVADEVAAKVKALAMPRDISVKTALVYDGHLAPAVEAEGYFDAVIPISELLTPN